MVVETGHSPVPSQGLNPQGNPSDSGAVKPEGYAAAPNTEKHSRWEQVVHACAEATPVLDEIIRQFWGLPVRLRFLSASTRNHYFWRGDDYHVSQLMLGEGPQNQQPGTANLRLSDTICSGFLNKVLGTRPHPFSFRQLSPFEASLLNEFSKELFVGLRKTLIKKNSKIPPNNQVVNLVWVMQLEEVPQQTQLPGKSLQLPESLEVGKLVLSLPMASVTRLSPPETEPNVIVIPDEFFFHVQTLVRIRLGSTRIPLSDLDQLESGDLVVFEDSQADRMWLVDSQSDDLLPFSVAFRNRQYLEVPYTQEIAMMENQQQLLTKQNLWDNLMIEVGAEFSPVKLPLKQLKQMSEGLVIELGDLAHNQIELHVDGRTLATGELIIVGDKFGVRISHVEASHSVETDAPSSERQEDKQALTAPNTEEATMQSLAMTALGGQTDAATQDADDDFLDSDFDDDTFDSEEDW